MKLLDVFWRFLRFPLHPCFFLLLVFAVPCVALQYPFYGEWLLRYPLFALIFAFLLLVTYNRFGQDFGLSHLFWHEKATSASNCTPAST